MPNKVEFGLSNVHVGTYTDAGGTVTLGEPVKIPGAVNLTLTPQSEEYKFFADDIVYYSDFSDNGETGELTMALFPDAFKTAYLGYKTLADGGVAKVRGEQTKSMYVIFEGKGDANKRRHILYNVVPGSISREYKAFEEQKEVQVETLSISLLGDAKTGIVKVSYNEGDTGYTGLITTPPVPTLPVTP